MGYLLGTDIGTTEVKSSLVSPDGKIVSSTAIEHGVLIPMQNRAEQDPQKDWWGDFTKTVKELLDKSKVDPSDIMAVGISGSYPDLCPASMDGKPLRNAILYSDNRCIEEVKYLKANYNLNLTPEEILPKLLWFKKHEPDKFHETRMIFSSHNYITYRLTNVYSIDCLSATSFVGLYNGLCEALGIPLDILPPIRPLTEVAGEVTEEASKDTGLEKGTPVIVGTADSFSGMLGIGAINKGDCVVNYGTAGFSVILNQSLEELAMGKFEDPRKVFALLAYVLTTGELLKWFRDNFCRYEIEKYGGNVYHLLDEEAEKIPSGSGGLMVIPYLRGRRVPVFDPTTKGHIYGLSITHSRAHLYRGVLESWGYAIRQGMERVQKDTQVRRIVATGGGAKSKVWRQIVTDIINKPQEYVKGDTSLANAFLAGYGIKVLKSFDRIRDWIKVSDVTHPNVNNVPTYDRYYRKYRDIESSLQRRSGKLE